MCPMCDSDEAIFLGAFGRKYNYRCRDCGWTYQVTMPEEEEIYTEFTCPKCEYEYQNTDDYELTVYEDHGMCWSCLQEWKHGEDLDESELRCLDCGTIFEPEDWLSPECPECTSKNYEG